MLKDLILIPISRKELSKRHERALFHVVIEFKPKSQDQKLSSIYMLGDHKHKAMGKASTSKQKIIKLS